MSSNHWIDKIVIDFKPKEGIPGISFPLVDETYIKIRDQSERKDRLKKTFKYEINISIFKDAIASYGYGIYPASIILSAASLEKTLRLCLKKEAKKGKLKIHRRIDDLSLGDLIDWCRQLGIINDSVWDKAHRIRDRRNKIVHVKEKEYEKLIKKDTDLIAKIRRKIMEKYELEDKLINILIRIVGLEEMAFDTLVKTYEILVSISRNLQ